MKGESESQMGFSFSRKVYSSIGRRSFPHPSTTGNVDKVG